jgi:hypothetical protein
MDETIGFDGKYIIMKNLEIEKWIFFKDEDGKISMHGMYELKRLIDYLDHSKNIYFNGILYSERKYSAFLRESLRERKLKQIGI